jgi:hypothetical protein
MMTRITGIDPSSWQVTLLPYPKGFTRSTALGFCGGHPVGMAERARGKSQACWWPDGRAELLALDGYKDLRVRSARDDAIPGSWSKGSSGASGAVVWRLRDGALVGTDLHDRRFEKTWAECTDRGVVLGVGVHKERLGARPADSGLVWRGDGTCEEIVAAGDVCLEGTDGTRIVGSADGRAAFWLDAQSAPVDLNPHGFHGSEANAIDGDIQAGIVFKGMSARAALWRGTADSFVDMTPDGYEVARILHAAHGWQVGLVRRRDLTRNGSSSLADQAALWQGSHERWVDLNAMLPAQSGLNASAAWSIDVREGRIQICGEAARYEISDPDTDRESHYSPSAQAVVWTARASVAE